jgi:N-acyl-D-amino-acid deacylase
VAISEDRIAAVAPGVAGRGSLEIDVDGLAVAPGFINMMSWAPETLIEDGRSMSDIRQGVTLEVFGEGTSMGPLNESMRSALQVGGLTGDPGGYRYPIAWRSLAEFLDWLACRGIAPNVASFVGAGTLRVHEAGYADRPLTVLELARMCALLEHEMRHGALGIASALIYPPETAYLTTELIALARVAAKYGGMYASHVRSEGSALGEAVAELVEITRRSRVRSEVYHLKSAGRTNWPALSSAIALIDEARREGLSVTADLYPYEYSGTSLTACLPPWAHEGGAEALRGRLHDPVARQRILEDLSRPGWENPFLDAGPDRISVRGPLAAPLAHHLGQSLSAIARARGTSPAEAVMDLVRDSPGDVFALYFEISPAGVRLAASQPWVSFCSDAESLSAESAARRGNIHPRAFGAFARVLGGFVREEGLFSLAEAIRRMTSLPAANLGLSGRGVLRSGCHADVVAFDPRTIADHATPEMPNRYASGVEHVLVNGVPVLLHGEHTGATPGRFVRGPGTVVT